MKRITALILAGIVALLLLALPVLAVSNITNARYQGTVTVTNSGPVATNLSVNCSISTPNLISGGFANSTATDTAWRNVSGTDAPFMPGWGTNPAIFFVPSAATGTISNNFYTGNVTGGTIAYFPDTAGMTTGASASLGIGNNSYEIEFSGYGDTAVVNAVIINGATYTYILKVDASNHIKLSALTDNASYYYLNSALTPGAHIIKITKPAAGTSAVYLYVDGVEKDTTTAGTLSGALANGFTVGSGGIPYINYFKLTIGGVLQQHITWQYAATFTDLSGQGHDATPSFRATSSSANVSASLTAFQPVNQAAITSFALSSSTGIALGSITAPSQMYTDVGSSANISSVPGADVVNALLDAGSDDPVDQAATETLFWYLLIFIGICVVGLMTYEVTTWAVTGKVDFIAGPQQYQAKYGIKFLPGVKDGSLLLAAIVMEFCLVIFSYWGAIPGLAWQMFLVPVLLLLSMKPEVKTY
jgi:hypothetical protein